MKLQYPKFMEYGADTYICDGDSNYFQDFVDEYEPECSLDEYRPGELLEELKQAFKETTLEVIASDLDYTLKQIVEVQ